MREIHKFGKELSIGPKDIVSCVENRDLLARMEVSILETHHIIALAKDGADRITNVIGLCADHHREAHFGALREELEKKMITKVSKAVET